jgi:hypothetical protein
MRYAMVIMGVLLQPAAGSKPQAPSLEMLLYLAEWGQDGAGELVDPLDLESPETPTDPGLMDTQPQTKSPSAEGQQ